MIDSTENAASADLRAQQREYMRAYRAKKKASDPDYFNRQIREWMQRNPDRRAAHLARYRERFTDEEWKKSERIKRREWREANREAHREQSREAKRARDRSQERRIPEHERARNAVSRAVRAGRLTKPTDCETCGALNVPSRRMHAHHRDYAKPLEVEWLCSLCHGKAHRID